MVQTGNIPVAHCESFEFPFVTKDILEKVFVFRNMRAVHAVVPGQISKIS